jgi:hypothetical protein
MFREILSKSQKSHQTDLDKNGIEFTFEHREKFSRLHSIIVRLHFAFRLSCSPNGTSIALKLLHYALLLKTEGNRALKSQRDSSALPRLIAKLSFLLNFLAGRREKFSNHLAEKRGILNYWDAML